MDFSHWNMMTKGCVQCDVVVKESGKERWLTRLSMFPSTCVYFFECENATVVSGPIC